MKMQCHIRFVPLLTLVWILLWPCSAEAVVPQLWSMMQGMLSFLPQLFLLLFFSISLIFRWSTWKSLFARWRSRPWLMVVTLIPLFLLTGYGYLHFFGGTAAPATPARLADWPMFGRGTTRRGMLTGGDILGQERWKFREVLDRAPFNSSPAVAGDRVYVGSDNNYLYCFDATTGDELWQFEAMYEVFCSPAVVDGRVYFGEGLHYVNDALFYCVDALTGDLIWQFQTTSHTESSPVVTGDVVLFGAGEDGVFCLAKSDGTERWHFPGVHVDASPLVADGRVYFGSGYGDERFFCLDLNTGDLLWEIPLDVPGWGAPSIQDGRVYFGVGNGNFDMSDPIQPQGGVFCVDADSGERRWYFAAEDAVLTSVALADGRAYFGSRDGRFYCVDATSGEEIWRYDAEAL